MPAESQRLHAVQSPIIPVIADLIRAHPGTISLGQGVVHYPPPPQAAAAIARFLAEPNNHKYQAVAGSAFLVERLEQKLARDNGLRAGAGTGARVMVTAGGNAAFMNALLALCDPGDEVILPTPYYFNHEMAITMANCRPMLVATDENYQLRLDALRDAITPRTRAIVTVSPNNPTGAVYPADALRAVNALCAERGLCHINDEAYEAFTFDGAAHFSPASVPGAEAHTISLFSMSKAYGFASWRIGWMVFPARLEAALRKIQDTLLICPPVISQYAAAGALEAGPEFIHERIRGIAEVRSLVQRELAPLVRDGVCEVPATQGALYFLVRLRSDSAPFTIAERLIREHRVAVIPGNAFGIERGCHLRVAYGALEKHVATEAIGRLAQGLRAVAGG